MSKFFVFWVLLFFGFTIADIVVNFIFAVIENKGLKYLNFCGEVYVVPMLAVSGLAAIVVTFLSITRGA